MSVALDDMSFLQTLENSYENPLLFPVVCARGIHLIRGYCYRVVPSYVKFLVIHFSLPCHGDAITHMLAVALS
jgi:hypothetical protein